MPIRGDLYLSPVCARDHHADCRAEDSGCECGCHHPAEVREPAANGAAGFDAPDVRAAVAEMRAAPHEFPCADPDCMMVWSTEAGARTHYARMHGPHRLKLTQVPEGLPPAGPRAVASAPERPSGPAPRTIAPERVAFLDRMRALRDEVADAEETAERELAQMRAVIVALDNLLDS